MNEIVLNAHACSPKILLFLFHGYGKNKENFLPIAKEFLKSRASIEIHIPDGVEKCTDDNGREWFEFNGENVSVWEKDFLKKSPQIIEYINEIVESKKLKYSNVVLAGFSQGAMVSLGIGLKLGVAGVIAFSGLMLDPKSCVGKIHTNVLLLHGGADDLIPVEAMKLTERVLSNAGVPVKSEISPLLKHEIDHDQIVKAIDFLKSL